MKTRTTIGVMLVGLTLWGCTQAHGITNVAFYVGGRITETIVIGTLDASVVFVASDCECSCAWPPASCEYTNSFTNFLALEPLKCYEVRLEKRPWNTEFECNCITAGTSVDSLDPCYTVVTVTNWWVNDLEQRVIMLTNRYTMKFSPECCLPPDGYSAHHPYIVGDDSPTVTNWSIVAPAGSLGCRINSTDGTVTNGYQPGTITVRAALSNGCHVDGTLDICSDEGGCGCKNCNSVLGAVHAEVTALGSSYVGGRVQICMGRGAEGESAGTLVIEHDEGASGLYNLGKLTYPYESDSVRIIRESSYIKQIVTLDGVGTVTNWTGGLRIDFYRHADSVYETNGLYRFENSPIATVTIENADESGETDDRTRVTELRDEQTTTWEFETISDGNQWWALTDGDGLRKEVVESGVPAEGKRSVTWSTYTTNDTLVAVRGRTVLWLGSAASLSEAFVGSGTDARTNYYVTEANGSLRESDRHNGSWEIIEYDSQNRPTAVYSAYLNSAPSTNSTECRVTEYTYSLEGYGDVASLDPSSPRIETERILNTVVSKRYRIHKLGETQEIWCPASSSTPGESGCLTNVTKTYTEGVNFGKVKSIEHGNGTMELYQYTSASDPSNSVPLLIFTNIVVAGEPNETKTDIVNGTRTVTVTDQQGRMLSRTVYAVQSGQSDLLIDIAVHTDFDDFGRARKVTFLDGTFTYTDYTCCGGTTVTNREGSVTSSEYDDLGRLTSVAAQSPAGTITTLYVYDAAGNLIETTRVGTDSSSNVLSSATFNTAGRRLTSTDAMTNITIFSESGTPPVRTTIYTNGATRVESYARDGSLMAVTGTVVHGVTNSSGFDNGQFYRQETKLDTNGAPAGQWVRTVQDLFGRTAKVVYPDDAATLYYYNAKGQLTNQVDPDGVSTLFLYNALGEREYTVLDMDRDGQVDWSGTDRITRTIRSTGTKSGITVQQVSTYVWATNNADVATLVSTLETSADGRTNWMTRLGLTTRRETYLDTSQGERTVITIPPAGPPSTNVFQDGQLVSSSRGILGSVTYGFDKDGRPALVTDARNGTITNWYDNADRLWATATPAPASGQSSQVTISALDWAGRATNIVHPDGASTEMEYFPTGELKKKTGAREYPVAYTYDYAGRMKTMTTWTNAVSAQGAAVTTWHYHPERGWLTNKVYTDGKSTKYGYTAGGRLETRLWARGTNTTYSYNNAGELSGVDYSDSTPDVSHTYDRLGRQTSTTHGSVTTTRAFDLAGNLLTEAYSGGPLDGMTVTNSVDGFSRRSALGLLRGTTALFSHSFDYDASNRLSVVSDGVNNATYSYLDNGVLVEQILFKENTTTRMTTTKAYDKLNRLTSVQNVAGGSPVASSAYAYNLANQRTALTNADSSRWAFGYDSLGQVTSGKKYWSDGTPVAGQQFEYFFDDIGNRKTAASGGNEWGTNLRYENYTANDLNQYTLRTVPGYVDVLGTAATNAEVAVWSVDGPSATYRKGEYFRGEKWADNIGGPVWLGLTNIGILRGATTNVADIVTTNSGFALVPPWQQTFLHDADGNLTNDSVWSYVWDGENRLVGMDGLATLPAAARRSLRFAYDSQGRRISKVVSNWTGSAWSKLSEQRFVYHGWNLLAILDSELSVIQSLVWGLDLSGTAQGAGGVGGLLAIGDSTNGVHFTCYDGNGNITALVSATNGTETARYEYSPFGQVLRASGTMAKANVLRFSTKFQDVESDLLYYGFRSYNPNTGRWLSRDPILERGGINLLTFLQNSPIASIDPLGLWQTGGPLPEGFPDSTIVCDGKGGIRVHLSAKQKWPCPALRVCATAHEEIHKRDVLSSNPDICVGKPDGTMIIEPDATVLAKSEVEAHKVALECIRNLKRILANSDIKLGTKCSGCTYGLLNVWEINIRDRMREWEKKAT